MKFKAGDRVAAVREIEPYAEGASGTVLDEDAIICDYVVEMDTVVEGYEDLKVVYYFESELEALEDRVWLTEGMPDVTTTEGVTAQQESIEDLLKEAAKEDDKLDMLITFLGDLTLGYETVRAANVQQGYELGALIYEGVRDHVHTALHLALDALEQRKENEEGTDDSTDQNH